jgi:polysaccharide pyruvyl transferase WcaK-like protein
MERQVLDTQHCHAVVAKMAHAQRATVLKGEYTSGQMLTIIGHFAFAVGMRLHFLIFAALQRVPFVALPYASKVTGFLDALEMPMPPLQQVNAGRLIAHIDRSWDLQADLQARIDRVLPTLQERARETNKIAVHLLLNRSAVEEGMRPAVGV